jgi:hypothetical protein
MRPVLLAAALMVIASCASNRNSDAAGARIRDTTLTARDTMSPSDTLPRIRDSMADSTRQ